MRFVHSADWHITAGKAFIPDSVHRAYKAIDEIYQTAASLGIWTVVVAGDIFDSPVLTEYEKHQLANRLLHFDDLGFTTLMIPGNHDKTSEESTTLAYLALIDRNERFKRTRVVEKTELVIVDGFGFLLFTGEPWASLNNHIDRIMNGSLDLELKGLIVVAHLTHKGAITDVGYRLEDGDEIEPSDQVLYYALGDIHLSQRVSPRAYYSGSPHQINFGEVPPNGILIVDTDKPDDPEFIEMVSVSKLITITNPAEEIPENCYARLKYEDLEEAPKELPARVIKVAVNKVNVDLSQISLGDGQYDGLDNIMEQRGLDADERKIARKELASAAIAVGQT